MMGDLINKTRAGSLALSLLVAACGNGGGEAPDAADAAIDSGPPDAHAAFDASSRVPACTLVEGWQPAPGCNGDEALCARRLDEVSMLTTHNAFSTEDDLFLGPNQRFCTRRQLEDGVRGFMLDVHEWRGELFLCHGACTLGKTPLAQGLRVFRDYLDSDPGAVVTLLLESYVSEPSSLVLAFDEADLSRSAAVHDASAPWPTLSEMVASEKRLVVLTDDARGGADWLLPMWQHAVDNPYAASEPGDFSCEFSRGEAGNALFIFNHFLTRTLGSRELAEMVNHNPFFGERVRACANDRGRLPNYVTVDFYDVGDGADVVRELNGL